MSPVTARAQARVGLLGNPSDLYGGRGLGFAVAGLGAEVRVEEATETSLPDEFLAAGWRVARAELEQLGVDPDAQPFRLTHQSNVPYQAGLSGSSALLVAALRAWCDWFQVPLGPSHIARLAWRTEVDELGIRAGALDRLVQAHEGLLAMDFKRPFEPEAVRRLDPRLLPPLLIAWHRVPGASSGDVHAPIYARFEAGDGEVTRVMGAIAANADEGCAALEARDTAGLLACINRNLDLRAELFELQPADRALIDEARERGIAAKLPGSGGSVLFACESMSRLGRFASDLGARGVDIHLPNVALPR
ncbi:mevalonate kinase [Engelhardtia mirabilis]|uniref:D-glycero-alpha-D-manno-heptose 7-phosphate kinase n=1 Tax=Engelhardtia mirabilis TaxID=2528011 RepID=A0A518BEE3_9BACT|nr:D-glycero-alpha-D-manno-heptose 7-phosphate kinase [Planctomycetes bacterium Pla133]QDU99691.1 D-glycero-alpha-D-manno-heptose 7-phosphate kinase [Planctomycetes bacterium Pla86]